MPKNIPINWFDIVVIGFAIAGVFRGRKRGMSQDLLDLLMWLGIVIGGGFANEPGGNYLAKLSHLSVTMSRVLVYLAVMILCLVIKSVLKDAIKDKLASSNVFGNGEYPLGMMSGAIRFLCILIMVMALMNADQVTAEQRAKTAKMQQENFGNIGLPTYGEVQNDIFNLSFCGKIVQTKLDKLLVHGGIVPSAPEPAKPADPKKK